ncbi:hypothetical protein GKZ89_18750 [Bacillus mangrovi]|uniref:Uncharacterized protein n=1 Tax=Metabacillus mangrovi TaxID=1491830 RepID=A0A7X2S888_9BACI|nr:hypothetical protein [Metabacillus mangrovi]MTH55434.1 hypothetical protein [Metabacillus mangrovi]
MKNTSKLFYALGFVLLIFSLFMISPTKSSAIESDFVLNTEFEDDESDPDVHAGLTKDEEVVESFMNHFPNNEIIDREIPVDLDRIYPEPFVIGNPYTQDERYKRWYAVSKTYKGLSYGKWKFAGASTVSGGRLNATHTKTVANKYSGTLKVPLGKLESVIGFDVTDSWSVAVGFISREYPEGRYRLEYRQVYKKYKVKQVRKYDHRVKETYGTQYVYPYKWVERQYRVVKF